MASSLKPIRNDLLRAARAQRTVTYGQLMKAYHLSRGRRLSHVIGQIDRAESERGAPGFAAIVVRKDTGLPGGGYFCDDQLPPGLVRSRDRSTDPKLSAAEKAHVLETQRTIWTYHNQHRSPRRPATTT